MSELGQSFIFSILPILLGLSLFLILTLFNPTGKKYVITKGATIAKESNYNSALPLSAPFPKNYLYDQLILRGVFFKKEEIARKVAFSRFGLLEFHNLPYLLEKKPPKNLVLISNSSDFDFLSRLSLSNSPQFAALIPYLLDSSLKVVIP